MTSQLCPPQDMSLCYQIEQSMTITVNRQQVETQATLLSQLADELKLPAQGVAIAVNNKMIPRTEWNKFQLSENDSIVIIKAACGG